MPCQTSRSPPVSRDPVVACILVAVARGILLVICWPCGTNSRLLLRFNLHCLIIGFPFPRGIEMKWRPNAPRRHSMVLNGASDFLVEVFGAEVGRHARYAVSPLAIFTLSRVAEDAFVA